MAKAMDVWFRFESDDDDEPTHEANTYADGDHFVIKWYHVDVGLVSAVRFNTLDDVWAWYDANGYQDYSA